MEGCGGNDRVRDLQAPLPPEGDALFCDVIRQGLLVELIQQVPGALEGIFGLARPSQDFDARDDGYAGIFLKGLLKRSAASSSLPLRW